MTKDTYKYITSHPIEDQLSYWIEMQHQSDPDMVALANKRIRAVKLLLESSVLRKETETVIRLYHYEIPMRDITRLTLIDPEFVDALNERTDLWTMTRYTITL